MSQTTQTILTIVYLTWLFLVLVLLYAIWRSGALRTQKMMETLIEVSLSSTQAANEAAKATRLAAEVAADRITVVASAAAEHVASVAEEAARALVAQQVNGNGASPHVQAALLESASKAEAAANVSEEAAAEAALAATLSAETVRALVHPPEEDTAHY